MNARFYLFSLIVVLNVSCSSGQKQNIEIDDFKETIIQRSDELDSRPDWAYESKSFYKENGNIYSLGSVIIPAEQRLDAAYKIAELNAKANFSKAISQKLEFIIQHAEEGMGYDNSILRNLTSEVSKINTNGMSVSNRYWEKFVTSDQYGNKKAYYKVFIREVISENHFNEQVNRNISSIEKANKFSKEFADKVEKQLQEI